MLIAMLTGNWLGGPLHFVVPSNSSTQHQVQDLSH